jgi:hypothetical protein
VFVIAPGLGLLGLGLSGPGRLGEVLAMTGGVVTMDGLVLLVQNATDRFDTWAWALVLLAGAGTGRWLVGVTRGRRDLVANGGCPAPSSSPPTGPRSRPWASPCRCRAACPTWPSGPPSGPPPPSTSSTRPPGGLGALLRFPTA